MFRCLNTWFYKLYLCTGCPNTWFYNLYSCTGCPNIWFCNLYSCTGCSSTWFYNLYSCTGCLNTWFYNLYSCTGCPNKWFYKLYVQGVPFIMGFIRWLVHYLWFLIVYELTFGHFNLSLCHRLWSSNPYIFATQSEFLNFLCQS